MTAPPHLHGRGTPGNPANRFERVHVAHDPDVFDPDGLPAPETQVFWDDSKSIIAWNKSPDIPFEAAINPYRGCEHGCVYCFARPYHEYLGFSAGLDFETRIIAKRNAADLLRREFTRPKWQPQVISISGVTDPYQPLEAKLKVTRSVLEVLAEFRNPVALITKNALVLRDLELLRELARHQAVHVNLSITTLDDTIRRVLEPRTSTIERRFEAVRKLAENGIPVGVMAAPIIPGLTDEDLPGIIARAAECGASWVGFLPVRLPHGVAELFETWLREHFPTRAEKVLRRVREMRGGELNDARFGKRMTGQGIRAESMHRMYELARTRHGLNNKRPPLNTKAFKRPGDTRQMF